MFYHFSQTNSGGSFIPPAINVIIEARNTKDVIHRAEDDAKLYFNGVASGRDCGCCGNRWSNYLDNSDGQEFPHIYGETIQEALKSKYYISWETKKVPFAKIYYLDGRVETVAGNPRD